MKNEYLPSPATVESVRAETPDTRTLRVVFDDRALASSFAYRAGQFMQVSLPGFGEAPISITSSPHRAGYLEFSIRGAGKLTRMLIQRQPGERIFLRGPYGNCFPVGTMKSRDLYFMAGGIGLVPLRSLINLVLDNPQEFGKVMIIYGARSPDQICFRAEIESSWERKGAEVRLIVDIGDGSWKGRVGLVTELWREDEFPSGGLAVVCGPPVMMKFAVEKLLRSGFPPEDICLTLERHMKCGIGKCGHCNLGGMFVCVDGPVFTGKQIRDLPDREMAL